jgi:hypothetical protein
VETKGELAIAEVIADQISLNIGQLSEKISKEGGIKNGKHRRSKEKHNGNVD